MLCFGARYLRGRARAAGWLIAGLVIVANGIGRIYTGAHWPSDVLGGILIAAAWLALVLSVRTVSERILSHDRQRRRDAKRRRVPEMSAGT